MSYSQRLGAPVCIFNHQKILELKKTRGPSTFQRLSKAGYGYIEIRIAHLCGIDYSVLRDNKGFNSSP